MSQFIVVDISFSYFGMKSPYMKTSWKKPPPAEWDEHQEMNDAFAQTDEFDEEQDETMFPELAPGLLRIPVILGLEALISGRILTDDAPIWWSIMLWTIFLIPIVLSGKWCPKSYFFAYFVSIKSRLQVFFQDLWENQKRPEDLWLKPSLKSILRD